MLGTLKAAREKRAAAQAEHERKKAAAKRHMQPIYDLEQAKAALEEQSAQEAAIAAKLDELRALRAPALETTEFWSGPNYDLLLKLHEGALLLEEAVKKNVAVAGLTTYVCAEFAARMYHQKEMVEAAKANLARYNEQIAALEG